MEEEKEEAVDGFGSGGEATLEQGLEGQGSWLEQHRRENTMLGFQKQPGSCSNCCSNIGGKLKCYFLWSDSLQFETELEQRESHDQRGTSLQLGLAHH